jgi:hypothetical protein
METTGSCQAADEQPSNTDIQATSTLSEYATLSLICECPYPALTNVTRSFEAVVFVLGPRNHDSSTGTERPP